MTSLASLQRAAQALTRPRTGVTLAAVVLAVLYARAVVPLPPGLGVHVSVLIALTVSALQFVASGLEQRRIATLRAIGLGALPHDARHLTIAAHEVVGASTYAANGAVRFLAVTAAIVVGGLKFLGVPWAIAGQAALIALAIAPWAAAMSDVLTWPRARAVLTELVSTGLAPSSLYSAVPVAGERRLRFALLAVASVLSPLSFVADQSLRQFQAEAEALQRGTPEPSMWPVLLIAVVAAVLVAAAALAFGRIAAEPWHRLAGYAAQLEQGDYAGGRFIASEFETWATSGALLRLGAELGDRTGKLTQARAAIDGVIAEFSGGRAAHLESAEEQAAALATTTATTEELARSARQIARNAQRVSDLARGTLEAARVGKGSADAFTQAMQQVREGNQAIADSVVRLNKRVQQVGRIIEFIEGIADKSDLLALNAELEGDKAGEVGRGFSLVAAEMRRLAESVMHSTAEIAVLIDDIRDATNAAVMATEAGVKATDAGAALAQKVGEGLTRIVEFANLSSDAMQSISLATGQQQAGTDQLVASMADILASTRAAATASRSMAATHDALLAAAKALESASSGGQS